MKTPRYDALIEERRKSPDEIARRKAAETLAEAARNLASLAALAGASEAPAAAREPEARPPEARQPEPRATTETVPVEGTPEGDRE